MKLETIKKDKKKRIIIGSMVFLSVVGCLTLTTTRAKYRNVQNIKLANGVVDYKTQDLKLAIKVSEDGAIYNNSNTIPEGNYTLNTEKSKCRIPTSTKFGEDAPEAEGVTIEYIDDKINVFGVTKSNTKCYIYLDKIQSQTISSILIKIKSKTDGSYKGSTTPAFSTIATGAETEENNGIFETDDPMYGENAKTYYWRGAATTNHVIFDGKCWRIVRINGDGTIRLIYNGIPVGNTCSGNGANADSIVQASVKYNETYENSAYAGWTYKIGYQRPSATPGGTEEDSNIKNQTELWLNSNFTEEQKAKIAEGKFCNDRKVKNDAQWHSDNGTMQYYAAYQRLKENTQPKLDCTSGDIYVIKVGAITADEVQFAGANGEPVNNTTYYLYSGQWYWTMTPAYWNGPGNRVDIFVVVGETYGYLSNTHVYNTNMGIRPVINLRSDVTFNSGSDGTQNNPYIVQ